MASSNFWGQLIRELRAEHGMSQRALCRKSGVNRTTLRKMEDGGSGSICTLDTLLHTLGYELEFMKVR